MIADSIRADLGVFVKKMKGMLLEGMIYHSNKKTRRSKIISVSLVCLVEPQRCRCPSSIKSFYFLSRR
jgi:hypothetical protein